MIGKIFSSLYNDIKYTNRFETLEDFINFYKKISVISSILAFFSVFSLFKLVFNYVDYKILLVSLLFSLIVWLLITIYFYIYPKLSRADYLKNIESELPLFLLYLYGLVSSGLPLYKALDLSARRGEEYPTIRKDLEYFTKMSNFLNMDIISSLMILANTTKSKKLKEVIYEIISSIRSGRDIEYTIERLFKQNISEYENRLRSFIDKSEYIMTIYSFLFVVFPVILLITVFLFTAISGNIYLIESAMNFSLVFFPFAYLILFYLIYLIQPKI